MLKPTYQQRLIDQAAAEMRPAADAASAVGEKAHIIISAKSRRTNFTRVKNQ
jgi:hypothetical protein